MRITNQQDATLAVLCLLKITFWPWNSTVLTELDIYTGFIPTKLMTNTSGCYYSLWMQRASETCRAYL